MSGDILLVFLISFFLVACIFSRDHHALLHSVLMAIQLVTISSCTFDHYNPQPPCSYTYSNTATSMHVRTDDYHLHVCSHYTTTCTQTPQHNKNITTATTTQCKLQYVPIHLCAQKVNALVLQGTTPPAQVAAGDDHCECKWSVRAPSSLVISSKNLMFIISWCGNFKGGSG